MSANLIGGFFQRLEVMRKYAFGSLLVFGEDNKSTISGYFIMRGQEIPEILTDVADYPSYTFTKVDPKDPQIKKNWEDYIAWDGELEGKKFADGKTFK
jgi:elongation factor 1-gamma